MATSDKSGEQGSLGDPGENPQPVKKAFSDLQGQPDPGKKSYRAIDLDDLRNRRRRRDPR